MTLLVPCSVGDLLDRITILGIKLQRCGSVQRPNVQRELDALCALRAGGVTSGDEPEMRELSAVNLALWEVEDRLRAFEAASEFGPAFIADARSVYRLNDRRAAIKKAINIRLGSALVEEKIHPEYK